MATISELSDQAHQYADQYGVTGQGTANNAVDAFRHAYASAVAARDYGSGVAEAAGVAWELLGLMHGDSEAASRMDTWNNYVGRTIQERLGPNATNDQIAAEVKKALDAGQLVTEPGGTANGTGTGGGTGVGTGGGTGGNPFTGMAWPGVDTDVNTNFTSATNWRPRRDPLAIDLDGDGIETLALGDDPVLFDHDANGVKTGTGWLKGDDAWLVLDRDGNGLIDSGRELFGVDTQITRADGSTGTASSGFEALAALDDNHDGIFNAQDMAFEQVRLWQDLNADGISQSTELFSLSDKGVVSINLNADNVAKELGNGNAITGSTTVTLIDGRHTEADAVDISGTAANLNLGSNPFYREFTDKIPLSDAAVNSPDMKGSGWLRDLREAMSLPGSASQALQTQVQTFASQTTRADQLRELGTLIDAWASTSSKHSHETSQFRAVSVVSKTTNGSTETVSYTEADPGTYDLSKHAVDATQFILPSGGIYANSPSASAELMRRMNVLETFNGTRFLNFSETYNTGGIGSSSGGGGGGGSGSGSGGAFEIPKSGWYPHWNITLSVEQIDFINQAYAELEESIYGALVLQTRLKPYLGDVILQIDEQGARFDTTALVERLAQTRVQDPLNATLDLAELNRYASSTLDSIGFDGLGTLRAWVDALPVDSPIRTELNHINVFWSSTSTSHADIILGDSSNNTISAGAGNDLIDGGGGNDTLQGDSGDDRLDGGAGNDILIGGSGADTYVFGIGSGKDFVDSYDTSTEKNDHLRLGTGIKPDDLSVIRTGNDLLISFIDSADQIRISRQFSGNTADGINTIQFADGSVWTKADIETKAAYATDGDNVLIYGGSDDSISALAGNDFIDGGKGNDQIDGGDGDDIIYGGAGDDYIDASQGNDTVNGGTGSDVIYTSGHGTNYYNFSKGDGQDRIINSSTDREIFVCFTDVSSTEIRSLNRFGDDLIIQYGDTDQITVQGYFRNPNDNGLITELSFTDGVTWDIEFIFSHVVTIGTNNSDTLWGYNRNTNRIFGFDGDDDIGGGVQDDEIYGGNGNDIIYGLAGNDRLYGGAGDDVIDDGYGADIIDGGTGNDTIVDEGVGGDTYIFRRGDGNDIIRSLDYQTTSDNIVFADIKPSDIRSVRRSGMDVIIDYGETDSITLQNYFNNPNSYHLEDIQVEFSDGTNWDRNTLLSIVAESANKGTEGRDVIIGFEDIQNYIEGFGGNDYLAGSNLDDRISGGDGDDNLSGNLGNDVLDGGKGNDYLNGSDDGDTYILRRGDGIDTIYEYGQGLSFSDSVKFVDIASQDITSAKRVGYDLVINYGDGDQLTVLQQFNSRHYTGGIETFRFSDDTEWYNSDWMRMALTTGTNGDDRIIGYTNSTAYIDGLAGDDTIQGGTLADRIQGGLGEDSLYGVDGNDTLDGGAGNDFMWGGNGDDTYVLHKGDGVDTIRDYADWGASIDTIKFSDIASTDSISLTRSYDDLIINYGSDDKAIIKYQFGASDPASLVEKIVFSDGVVWDAATIASMTPTNGTEIDDVLFGDFSRSNYINGLGGDDLIFGGAYSDKLSGGPGNDLVNGSAGDDILTGGTGADSLNGNIGNDVYIFNRGDEFDEISDDGDTDKIVLGADIASDQLIFIRSVDNLEVRIAGSQDGFVVKDWFSDVRYQIETFELADGSNITSTQVNALVDAMASFAPPSAGQTVLAPDYQSSLQPVIAANWH